MKITKLGHCCLLIEYRNLRILTDPGFLSNTQDDLKGIDMVLITHEHKDHLHTDSLLQIIKNNPEVAVITNTAVGNILTGLGVVYTKLEGEDSAVINSLKLHAHDGKHEEICGDYGIVQNTGYFIDEKLFYPGDSYSNPKRAVTVLALPVAGPWATVGAAINYALEIKPEIAFPVHDGLLNEQGLAITHGVVRTKLEESGLKFTPLKSGEVLEFD